ncbi:MAG: sigma-70 family RNA polymerase sigma factor [Saprospiraceae bacterium]
MDRNACRDLYDQFNQAMYNTCLRMLSSEAEALDALQDTFVSVFKNIHTLNDEKMLPAWIKKICVNTCLKQIEKNKKFNFTSFEDQPILINLNDEDEIVDELEYSNKLEAIQWAIEQLPDKYRIVFNLYAIENYSHEQISDMILIPSATCRSQYMRAKQKIIDLIKKNNNYAGSIQKISTKA